MSYNLVILEQALPADDVEAWELMAELAGRTPQGEIPAVYYTLIDRLTARYPCLSELPDDKVDDGVWSDGPLKNNAGPYFTMLGISTSRVAEVLPFVIETAHGLGLSVMDGQESQIHRPTGRGAVTPTTAKPSTITAPPPTRTPATTPVEEPRQVVLHVGQPIPDDMEFFGSSKDIATIGNLYSKCSTLRKGVEPKSFVRRLIPAFLAGLTVAVIGVLWAWGILQGQTRPGDIFIACFPLLGVPGGIWLTWYMLDRSNFRHISSYVGDFGVFESRIKQERGHIDKETIFLFKDATDLFTSTTNVSHNGVYTGTQYVFTWKDAAGQKIHRMAGSYHRNKVLKKIDDPSHFATATELAWSLWLLRDIQERLDRDGYLEFKVNNADVVRVGKGFIELSFKGKTQRIKVEEIGKLTLGSGIFHVRHKDAGWWGGAGKFQFEYGKMANGRVFLLALRRLCGLQFN